jgi:hypothetical protein
VSPDFRISGISDFPDFLDFPDFPEDFILNESEGFIGMAIIRAFSIALAISVIQTTGK